MAAMAGGVAPMSLEVLDLSFRYRSGAEVIQSSSMRFAAGSTTAITGPSGRGKSTLLYLLGLMLRPSGGEILLGESQVGGLPDSDRAHLRAAHFGFVFQDAALDASRTVLENVTEGALYIGRKRSAFVARAQNLLDRLDVNVPADSRPGQVSGGQAQRIAMCRALLLTPSIVLADEPTGNLDPASSDAVVSALQEHARQGGTVVIVTHSPEVAAACDVEIQL